MNNLGNYIHFGGASLTVFHDLQKGSVPSGILYNSTQTLVRKYSDKAKDFIIVEQKKKKRQQQSLRKWQRGLLQLRHLVEVRAQHLDPLDVVRSKNKKQKKR